MLEVEGLLWGWGLNDLDDNERPGFTVLGAHAFSGSGLSALQC